MAHAVEFLAEKRAKRYLCMAMAGWKGLWSGIPALNI
jgi:hypothetical protein